MLTTIIPLIFLVICVLMVFVLPGLLLHAYLHRRRTGKLPKWLDGIPEKDRRKLAPYLTYFAVAVIAGVLLGLPDMREQDPYSVYFSAYAVCTLFSIVAATPGEGFFVKLMGAIAFLGFVLLHLAYPYVVGAGLVEVWDMLRPKYSRPAAATLATLGVTVALGLHMVVMLLVMFFTASPRR